MYFSIAQIPLILSIIFLAFFIAKLLNDYKKNKKTELLYVSIFFSGVILIYLFGLIRLSFSDNYTIDLFFWWISALSGSLLPIGLFSLANKMFNTNKKRKKLFSKLIFAFFTLYIISLMFMPNRRIITNEGTEWVPHMFTIIVFILMMSISIFIALVFLSYGFKNKNLKSSIFGFGLLCAISGLFLDSIGSSAITTNRTITLIGVIIIFLSFNYD